MINPELEIKIIEETARMALLTELAKSDKLSAEARLEISLVSHDFIIKEES